METEKKYTVENCEELFVNEVCINIVNEILARDKRDIAIEDGEFIFYNEGLQSHMEDVIECMREEEVDEEIIEIVDSLMCFDIMKYINITELQRNDMTLIYNHYNDNNDLIFSLEK